MTTNGNKIFYVRHAQTVSNITTDNLINSLVNQNITKDGIKQTNITAKHILENIKYLDDVSNTTVEIIISPLTRAIETAKPLISLLKEAGYDINILVEPLFREYTPLHKQISKDDQDKGIVNDINWNDFLLRVVSANDYLKLRTSDKKIIFVFSHTLFLSTLLTYQSVQEKYLTDALTSISLHNCSITYLQYIGSNKKIWRINKIGSVTHLPDELLDDPYLKF